MSDSLPSSSVNSAPNANPQTPQTDQPRTQSNTNEQAAQHGATGRNTSADSSTLNPPAPKKLHYSQIPGSPPTTPLGKDEFGNHGLYANRENAKYPFRTDSQIAYALGINRGTVWRWKTFHPLFRSELARKRNEVWGAAGDRFRKLLFQAFKCIKDQLKDEKALVRFRAAKTLINFAAHDRFAPSDDSSDPNDYLNAFALKRRAEIHIADLDKEAASDSERASALATLLAQSEDSSHYPPAPNVPPDAKPVEMFTDIGFTQKYPRR